MRRPSASFHSRGYHARGLVSARRAAVGRDLDPLTLNQTRLIVAVLRGHEIASVAIVQVFESKSWNPGPGSCWPGPFRSAAKDSRWSNMSLPSRLSSGSACGSRPVRQVEYVRPWPDCVSPPCPEGLRWQAPSPRWDGFAFGRHGYLRPKARRSRLKRPVKSAI